MKYKIIALSVTGVNGKKLHGNEVHPDSAFVRGTIDSLIKGKFIEEFVEPQKKATKKKAK